MSIRSIRVQSLWCGGRTRATDGQDAVLDQDVGVFGINAGHVQAQDVGGIGFVEVVGGRRVRTAVVVERGVRQVVMGSIL